VDAVDMLTIAFQLVGRPSHAAQAARAQFEQLRLALVNSPDDGVEALARLQAQLAPVVERAWLTARNVAERGHYDPADLPDIFKMRFISRDEQRVALYVYPSGDIWQREVADAFTARLEEVDPQATGFAITTNRHIYLIVDGFKRAAVIAGLLVLVMLLIDLRSPVDVLLAMLPVFLGGLWMLGLMSAASIPLNVANIVVLPLILGIGIDAGVHLVHRCRESAAANKGIARLDDLLRGTGAAVMVSSMTTMAGFAGLMVADYGAMRSLGLAMVIGVATCLLASLLVLPAVLLLMGRVR
jgi:multidrug efflux pump subunit AcrB